LPALANCPVTCITRYESRSHPRSDPAPAPAQKEDEKKEEDHKKEGHKKEELEEKRRRATTEGGGAQEGQLRHAVEDKSRR